MPRTMDIDAKIRSLRAFYRRENRMPGYDEMLRIFKYRSKNAVHALLLKLDRLGYIRKTGRKVAATGRLTGGIRLLGAVQAGFPSPAEEELLDTMNLEEYLAPRREATFMLTVSGDSMIDAGIHPGDLVLVERGVTPKPNDIVVAQVDGEWTLKYFTKNKEGVCLVPANRRFKPIRPRQSLAIGGVVRTVIRKYA